MTEVSHRCSSTRAFSPAANTTTAAPQPTSRRHYVSALYVCLIRLPYTSALCVCRNPLRAGIMCLPYVSALYVCLIRLPYVSAATHSAQALAVDASYCDATYWLGLTQVFPRCFLSAFCVCLLCLPSVSVIYDICTYVRVLGATLTRPNGSASRRCFLCALCVCLMMMMFITIFAGD